MPNGRNSDLLRISPSVTLSLKLAEGTPTSRGDHDPLTASPAAHHYYVVTATVCIRDSAGAGFGVDSAP